MTIEIDQEGKEIVLDIPRIDLHHGGLEGNDFPQRIEGHDWKIELGGRHIAEAPMVGGCVSIFYAVVADAERELRDNTEAQRAERRDSDSRSKAGLVAVKRLELARRWLLTVLHMEEIWRVRRTPLSPRPPMWSI